MTFEWDESKNRSNQKKHGISFESAQNAFFDPNRLILSDEKHSKLEERYFCIGNTRLGIITVRFTMRNDAIRIFGAGLWRLGKKLYEGKD
jgi:uncharacterized DUF497 family protein